MAKENQIVCNHILEYRNKNSWKQKLNKGIIEIIPRAATSAVEKL